MGKAALRKKRGERDCAYLIFALEHEDVGDSSERDAEVNDLRLRDFVRDVADVHDARRLSRTSRLQFHLLSTGDTLRSTVGRDDNKCATHLLRVVVVVGVVGLRAEDSAVAHRQFF